MLENTQTPKPRLKSHTSPYCIQLVYTLALEYVFVHTNGLSRPQIPELETPGMHLLGVGPELQNSHAGPIHGAGTLEACERLGVKGSVFRVIDLGL